MTNNQSGHAYQRSELDFSPLNFHGLGYALDAAILRLSHAAASHGRLTGAFYATEAAEADRARREREADAALAQATNILYSLSDRVFAERITERDDPRCRVAEPDECER